MTPTTSSPSILLLNPTVPSAKSAVATGAEAAPDAGLSGFELLLGAIQQAQPEPPATATSGDTEIKNGEQTDSDDGNLLPQLGMLLPSLAAPQPQAAADEPLKADAEKNAKTDSDDDDDKTVDANPVGIVTNGWLPFATAQTPAPAIAASTAATAADTVAIAQLDITGAGSGDNRGNKSTRATGVSLTPSIAAGTVNADDATALSSTLNTAKPETAAPVDSAKLANNSDFDTLVKHFEEPAKTLPAMSVGDSTNVNQASRTYANAANTVATVAVPVGSNGWSDAVADKVMWFSANKISSAEIHLNPPDLGPLQVRVSTQHDQASVVFTSQHAVVRDALDQALPRLRDMMGSQGMHLLDVSVGGQSAQQQQQQQQFSRNDSGTRDSTFGGFFADESAESSIAKVTTINTARLLRSGVDAYA